MTVDHHAM